MSTHEPLQWIEDYLDGQADAGLLRRLQGWLEADPANLDVFARQVFLHQQLRSYLAAEDAAQAAAEESDAALSPAALPAAVLSPTALSPAAPIVLTELLGQPSEGMSGTGSCAIPGTGSGIWPGNFTLFLLLAVVAVVGGVAFQVGRSWTTNRPADPALAAALAAEKTPCVARLVKLTNCAWDTTRTTADLSSDSQLRPGQSLHLIEGVAEINSSFPSGVVESFQLEGPVGLMMASQGVPSLLYGKMSAKINRPHEVFSLDTPLGRVSVAADASLGVSASANEVKLHVFSGSAIFDPLALFRGSNANRRLNVFAGAAVQITSSSDGLIAVEQGEANEEEFVTPASMSASHLNISENYVAAIKKAAPLAYWRFDRVENGLVPNEMGDQFACRVEGPVRWRTYPAGNRSAEFGFATQPGLLLTDESLDTALAGGFTIEFWVKPSYFESATIFSLDRIAADNVDVPLQGAMVELTGPATDAFAVQQSRIRFLHRNPPSRDVHSGVSAYSSDPYAPRKWQHVAAVKEGDAMRLYVDGKLAARGHDAADTAGDLRVLMGQLYSFTKGPNAGVRPFVGELAEVAIYDRALTAAEINGHIRLAHEEAHARSFN